MISVDAPIDMRKTIGFAQENLNYIEEIQRS